MTLRWIPIIFIWLTVTTAFFELFSQLQMMFIDIRWPLSFMLLTFFIASLITGWRQFHRDSESILESIHDWDDDMKKDIPVFLRARKMRLITAVSFLCLIMAIRFLFPFFSERKDLFEGLSYILLIGLLHVALVASLVLFKISRTVRWVRQENEMARLEKP